MKLGTEIIWSNSGGELERQYVEQGKSVVQALVDMVNGAGELHDGDIIRVKDVNTED